MIYLDHSATTPLDKEVLNKMLPYFIEKFGNASSLHGCGREAVKAVDASRDKIAGILCCKSSEIYFASGGTEADNWAMYGAANANSDKGKHILVSPIEHSAVYSPAVELKKQGFDVEFLKVNGNGIIDVKYLESRIRKDTILIAVMFANNEAGTIQPVDEIADIAKSKKILFFTDAVQAAGSIKINLKNLPADLVSLSAHKIYGPKGIGCLFIRSGAKIGKLISGGHQERTMRGGTTNVPLIVGFAEAFSRLDGQREENNAKIKAIRDAFIDKVLKNIESVRLNGDREKRLVNNANFTFEFIEGESLLLRLDMAGIAASTGSACSSGSLEPSRTLLAMGLSEQQAHGSLRFSFGKNNTMEEVDITVKKLKEIVADLRELSPLFKVKEEIKYV